MGICNKYVIKVFKHNNIYIDIFYVFAAAAVHNAVGASWNAVGCTAVDAVAFYVDAAA